MHNQSQGLLKLSTTSLNVSLARPLSATSLLSQAITNPYSWLIRLSAAPQYSPTYSSQSRRHHKMTLRTSLGMAKKPLIFLVSWPEKTTNCPQCLQRLFHQLKKIWYQTHFASEALRKTFVSSHCDRNREWWQKSWRRWRCWKEKMKSLMWNRIHHQQRSAVIPRRQGEQNSWQQQKTLVRATKKYGTILVVGSDSESHWKKWLSSWPPPTSTQSVFFFLLVSILPSCHSHGHS